MLGVGCPMCVAACRYTDVASCVEKLESTWASKGAAANFTHEAPPGQTIMASKEVDALVAWLNNVTDH